MTKAAVGAVAGLLTLGGAAWVTDTVAAIRAEQSVSERVAAAAELETAPSVYIGGIPYLGALWTHEIPLLEVRALDVEVAQLGMVNAATTLRDVTVTPEQVWSGNIDGATASTLSRTITLDGVALGRLLGITDLSIANPTDISPSGGSASEAELTGTIPGDSEKSTVIVSLRLDGPYFRMTPVDAASPHVRDAFSLDLDTRRLPLPAQATMVSLRGGSISFEVQRRNVTIATAGLSPLEIDGAFDSEGKRVAR